ncbi:MAG: SDR family NAD(P)-dependent oxidoreductase [Myxococcales bacterium]|nr:SDR family NAD(P)-dependent oxidoreductase [Myxococcales bacterium]USN50278.1 MAG: SDR family NAD(P)-dependent oxidoreductase [Myxococcales bacterium]
MLDETHQVAIVGMACNLPKANNPLEFMDFLIQSNSAIRSFPQERRDDLLPFIDDIYHHRFAKHLDIEYQRGGFLNRIDGFDHHYFKVSPSEAEVMDPAQRLFLQQAIKAIEDAGYAPEMLRKSDTGVYIGYMPDYRPFNYKDLLIKKPDQQFDLQIPNNLPAVIASRISYFLDLKGPALCIDTACSSVMTALDLAVQAIQNKSITGAIVGGVKIMLAPLLVNGQSIAIESPDFESKPFDASANGVGIGEGVGALYLKPLHLARKDQDFIYCIIEASSTNQDGRSLGLAAPNPHSQENVVVKTWGKSSVNAKQISFLEAHGTGTKVGDPIEVAALSKAFTSHTNDKQFCYLSSVKGNIGHLYEASGIPSLIKTALSVYFKKKFPICNFKIPNYQINFANTPFYVGKDVEDWPEEVRYAGINSFGMSGTNAHVLIRNDDNSYESNVPCNEHTDLLVISAKSHDSLVGLLKDYLSYLPRNLFSFQDICHTSRIGRSHYNYRFAVLAKNWIEAKNLIYAQLSKKEKIEGCVLGKSAGEISEIALSYVQGENIEWQAHFNEQLCRRVPIPTYHFHEQRAWVSFDPLYEEKIREKNKFHHHYVYKKYLELKDFENINSPEKTTTVALLASERHLEQTKKIFISAGYKIIAAKPWQQFEELIKEINGNTDKLQIVWCGEMSKPGEYDLLQAKNLRLFAKSLNKLSGFISLAIATQAGSKPIDEDFIDPVQRMIHGLAISLAKETKLNVQLVDRHYAEHLDSVAKFLKSNNQTLFSYLYKDAAYKRVFTGLALSPEAKAKDCLTHSGVYIISGGLGGIGLSLANYLMEKWSAQVILLSRHGRIRSHYRETFSSVLSNHRTVIKTNFYGLQQDWETLFSEINDKYGAINGIYHLAGVPSAHLLAHENDNDFDKVLDPKIYQTKNLIKALSNANIKNSFVALFSSVASYFPSVGQSSYSMANNFMDGLALSYKDNLAFNHICSLAWVAFKDIGMAKDAKTNVDTSFKAILCDDAIEQMHRMIASKSRHGLIGEINYKMGQLVKELASYGYELGEDIISMLDPKQQAPTPKISLEEIEVELVGNKHSQASENLILVAKIWSKHLGYRQMEVEARLYDDLGGDSIMATQIARDIEIHFGHKLNISDLIDSSLLEVALTIDKMTSLKNSRD